jgi:hypothetical protein
MLRHRRWLVAALAVAAAVLAARGPLAPTPASGQARDTQAGMKRAAPGTRFAFEVIESKDAEYLGDTPSHRGRDGGLEFRPHVALGDAVHRTEAGGVDRVVGRITSVTWERVSGSLTVEFDPEPLVRIAVGDEVWIDLNPAVPPAPAAAPAAAPSAAPSPVTPPR